MKALRALMVMMVVLVSTALADPPGTIDGLNIKTDFGTPQEVQRNHTGFGDYSFTGLDPGSEVDELFLAKSATKLYVGITGNLQTTGHSWMICINDTTRTGQSENRTEGVDGPPFTLQSGARLYEVFDNETPEDPTDDYWEYTQNGMVFPCDTDYIIAIDTYDGYAHISLYTLYDPAGAPAGTFDPTPDNPNDPDLDLFAERLYVADTAVNDGDDMLNEQSVSGFTEGGFDNTNILGVTTTSAAAASTATTGLELAIPFAALDLAGTENISIYVMMMNGVGDDTGTVSNQVLPALDDSGNPPCDEPGDIGRRDEVDLSLLMDCHPVSLATLGAFGAAGDADGVIVDADYAGGVARETQGCPTPESYGDQVANPGSGERLGGSELDALYVDMDGDALYLGLTGNLKENDAGHRLNIWIDSIDGGVNEVTWDPMWGDPLGAGMEGDFLPPAPDGSTPLYYDYVLSMNFWPGPPPAETNLYVDLWDLQASASAYVGEGDLESGSGTLGGGSNQWGIEWAADNTNALGVLGCGEFEDPCWYDSDTFVANLADDVESGSEIRLPLAALGINPCDGPATIYLWAQITDKGGYRSNQTLPALRDAGEESVWNPGDVQTYWYVSECPLPETCYRAVATQIDYVQGDLEDDCNDNDIEDDCDILSGYSLDENYNGIPDECEGPNCPAEVTFVATPPSGAIDARKPHSSSATTPCYGFGMPDDPATATKDESTYYPIVIDLGVDGADAECWSYCETPDMSASDCGSNSIASVTDNTDGTYTIILNHGIQGGTVATIQYNGGSYAEYFHHPANADGSGASNANDIVTVVDCLNYPGTCENFEADIDVSGAQAPNDIIEEIDLLNGAGAYEPWFNTNLPVNDGSCP